ncbi:hypothetical protein ACHAXR_009515 [Thalassiosira sp. AJA248-18]
MKTFFLLCCLLLACLTTFSAAFVQPNTSVNVVHSAGTKDTKSAPFRRTQSFPLSLRLNEEDDKDVNVNLVPNVDAFTLTAVGFGLIAFNFLVLGNMGDMGVGGVVARIINTFG